MALIATITFHDDDPRLHVHFEQRAHQLDDYDPVEWVRVLRTLEEACTAYAQDVQRVRTALEDRLTMKGA